MSYLSYGFYFVKVCSLNVFCDFFFFLSIICFDLALKFKGGKIQGALPAENKTKIRNS